MKRHQGKSRWRFTAEVERKASQRKTWIDIAYRADDPMSSLGKTCATSKALY